VKKIVKSIIFALLFLQIKKFF